MDPFQYNLAGMFLWRPSLVTLYQDCSSCRDSSKKHGSQGQGLFSLYNYIETTGQSLMLLGRNDALVTFYQDSSSCNDTSKNMSGRWRGLFSLYIYTENFKILLVRNHLTDFNITWQECSFGDSLPRLFKQ